MLGQARLMPRSAKCMDGECHEGERKTVEKDQEEK